MRSKALEKFYKLFLNELKFSYDTFDRIVLNGYIMSFHKDSYLEYYFKVILRHLYINQKLLFSVTKKYNNEIEAFANQHKLSCEWAEKGVRKEEFVEKYRHAFEKKNKFGVYYILRSKENESTFRVARPHLKDTDPDNFLAKTRKPFGHYYFYIHDQVLGNMCIRVASYLPFKITAYLNGHSYIERYLKNTCGKKSIYKKRDNAFVHITDINKILEAKEHFTPQLVKERLDHWLKIIGPSLEKHPMPYDYFIDQIEYCRNFIFKSHSFLSGLFKRSCEISLQLISTDNIRQIFGHKAKDEQISKGYKRSEDGYHVFKSWFKRCSVKQYRKFSNFLRYELTCNNLPDLKLKKALDHLPEFKEKAEEILDRYSETEAEMMNCHAGADYFVKHSRPVMVGQTKISGIHVYQQRVGRLLEVLLHDNRSIGQWKSMQLLQKILTDFHVSDEEYSRNQVIYDIRKLRAHGLVEKIGRSNTYRLTSYGVKIALAFTLIRKRIYGPLHYSLFDRQPDHTIASGSKLERLYRNLDGNINEIEDYLSGCPASRRASVHRHSKRAA
jgi:hypothetical protein